jgi:hypothetical protein
MSSFYNNLAGSEEVGARSRLNRSGRAGQITQLLATTAAGTEAANAVTINAPSGVITTSALTNAQNASYTITMTNSFITTTSRVFLQVDNATSAGCPIAFVANPCTASTCVIKVVNPSTVALNAAVKIAFIVLA